MKKKLGEILVEQGAVRPEDLAEALAGQTGGDARRVGELLLAAGKVTATALARALAAQLGMPFVQLDQVQPEVAALVPMELQREHMLVPFRDEGRGKAVHIAVADPLTRGMAAELELQLGRPVIVSLAPADEILSVHAALDGDVVPAVILDEGEPAGTEPLAPVPARTPAGSQALAKLVLKKVAVLAGPPGSPVPAFAADVPPLELPSPPVRPRTGGTGGKGLPAVVPAGAPLASSGTASMRSPAEVPRAKRPSQRLDAIAAPPVLKPAVPEPAASPKKPRTAPRLPRVPAQGDEWAVKDAGRALPPPEPPAPSPLPKLFEADPIAPTETARLEHLLDTAAPTETAPVSRKATAAPAPRAEPKKPAPAADPWEPAPSPSRAPAAAAVAADPWAPPVTAEPTRSPPLRGAPLVEGAVSPPSDSRGAAKASAQFPVQPSPPTREITTSVQFLLPEQREEAKKVLAWSEKGAPPVGAGALESGAMAALPEWMREAGGGAEGAGDALTAAVEKAVLVSGAPRTVARLLRLLVDRGLLTEREILDELSKP
jgi:hypothetical protein